MICLVKDNAIVYGPAPWNLPAVLAPLIVAGFDLREGALHAPDKAKVCDFPDAPPKEALDLPGFTLLPVAELNEPAPEGKALAGRDAVILEDRVELRPIWADIPPPPPPPSLEEVKAARKAEATANREQARARGVLFGEARLAAMPEDQGAYGDAVTYLGWKPEGAVLKWKAASGWIEVDLPALRAAAEAVGDFIETLFEIEHNHHAAIDALADVAAVQAYDVAAGWPE